VYEGINNGTLGFSAYKSALTQANTDTARYLVSQAEFALTVAFVFLTLAVTSIIGGISEFWADQRRNDIRRIERNSLNLAFSLDEMQQQIADLQYSRYFGFESSIKKEMLPYQ
jgi:hypothetical protein